MQTIKPSRLMTAGALAVASLINAPTWAANWLLLQGTEPAISKEKTRIFGFIQAQYQQDESDPNDSGAFIPPKLIGPNLTSQSGFNINRARIGLRGRNFPKDEKFNYFVLLEAGNNGITAPNDSSVRLTDASVTATHIEGAKIRFGLFKTPGAEESLQSATVNEYINFTWITNSLLNERLPESVHTGNIAPTDPTQTGISLYGFTKPVAAFRDVGIQVFDAFKQGKWEHSYAAMIGNGNGLNLTDNDDNKDLYLYLSTEKIHGGKGGKRQGLKMFAWAQRGTRTYDGDNDGINEEYDRDRHGVGFKYRKNPWRFSGEYMAGEGMIYVGPDKPSFDINGPANPNGSGLEAEASGWYLEGGWLIPKTKWELDLRYDIYHRLEDDAYEMEFSSLTLGTQYHFNKKTRITFNMENRSAEAVSGTAQADAANNNLDGVDVRYAVQVTAAF